jgi:hypothetical protein
MESFVPVIKLKELPTGFSFISASAVAIDDLPSDVGRHVRDTLSPFYVKSPGEVICAALFGIATLNQGPYYKIATNVFGQYTDLAEIKATARIANSRHKEIVEKLEIQI